GAPQREPLVDATCAVEVTPRMPIADVARGVGSDDVLVPADLTDAGRDLFQVRRAVPGQDSFDGLVVLHPLRIVDGAGAVFRTRDDRAVDRAAGPHRVVLVSRADG